MDEAGNQKDDLSLPKGTDDSEKLAAQIQEDFDAGKELVLTVLKVSQWLLPVCDGRGWSASALVRMFHLVYLLQHTRCAGGGCTVCLVWLGSASAFLGCTGSYLLQQHTDRVGVFLCSPWGRRW